MIIKLNKKYLNQFKAIAMEFNSHFTQLYDIAKLVNAKQYDVFLYLHNEELIGFIMWKYTYDVASILHLYTRVPYRRQKVATLLIDYGLSQLSRVTKVVLEVSQTNFGAIQLYQKLGFEIVPIQSSNDKVVVMEKRCENA